MNLVKCFQALSSYFYFQKTPRIIQMEATECGAVALAIILGYYGYFISLEELRVMCGVSREGMSAYRMIQAAKHYGLKATGYEIPIDAIETITTPAILYWNYNHFVVVEKIKKNKVYINDPATGPRSIDYGELKKSYSNLVIEFSPKENFEKKGKKKSISSYIIDKISPFKHSIMYLFFVELSLIVVALTLPAFSNLFIEMFFQKTIPHWTDAFFVLMGSVLVFTGLVTWIRGKFLNILQLKLSIYHSTKLLWHILRLPLLFFKERSIGEVVNRIGLNYQVLLMFSGELLITCVNLFFVGIYALIMFQYSIVISLIAIVTTGMNLAMLWYITRSRANAYARLKQEDAKTIAKSFDAITYIETIKSNVSDSYFFSRMADLYTKSINAMQTIGMKDNYLAMVTQLFQYLAGIALLTIGCLEILNGRLTVGMLIAFQILLMSFLKPFRQIIQFSARLQSVEADLARIDDVAQHSLDPLVTTPPSPHAVEKPLQGKVECEKVTFGYCPLEVPLLKRIDVTLLPGEFTVLIGPVGCGKSTLAKVMAHLYKPWGGKVLYDGKEYLDIASTSFRRLFAMIDQTIHIFAGTIKENIALWDTSIPEEKIAEAAFLACLDKDIANFSEGYDMQLQEEGKNLSQGQRQRVEIARALSLDPSILIMDEATNALDVETEARIIENIKEKKITCMMIAHRLSTLKYADNILFLDKGTLTPFGNYRELERESDVYKYIFSRETL